MEQRKRESISCMWRVPILIGFSWGLKTPLGLGPSSGPPSREPQKHKNLTTSTINHKGVLDLTHWLM